MVWSHEKRAGHAEVRTGVDLRDAILGGQDGLVNVLGVILAVATATQDVRIVIIAGLAATFAESISMAAVAYTSMKAARDFYRSELEREKKEIKEMPDVERKEIRDIYRKKGFRGTLLNNIVSHITRNEKVWLGTMMDEELHLSDQDYKNPLRDAAIVGVSAIIGSLIPLLPFLIFDIRAAVIGSLIFSTLVLFFAGVVKGKLTTGRPVRSGVELAIIGIAAAVIGYAIGVALGVAFYAA
jgi:VIT1/CCC1 family predicted Fe2+/Mn2+ transporter